MVYAKGGFRLTKFVCNNRAVVDSIPVGERYKETRTLDLHRDLYCPSNVPLVSSGVWNQKSSNSVSFLKTNRQLEEEYYSSVYDPLGFAVPFILPAKKILQDLCREDIGWDEEVSEEYRIRWGRWINELLYLRRCEYDGVSSPLNLEQ